MTEEFPKKGLYWHVHHDVLMEWCTSYQERVYYIRREKPANEIELRLRLMRPVIGELSGPLASAIVTLTKFTATKDEYADALYEVNSLIGFRHRFPPNWVTERHKIQCSNCPWDGKTIFPKGLSQ